MWHSPSAIPPACRGYLQVTGVGVTSSAIPPILMFGSALLARRPFVALVGDRTRPYANNPDLAVRPIHLIQDAQAAHSNPPHILMLLERRTIHRTWPLPQRALRLLHATPRCRMQTAVVVVRIVRKGDAPEQMAGGYWSTRKK